MTTRSQHERRERLAKAEVLGWYDREGLPAALAKKTGQTVEGVKAQMGVGRRAPRGPRPDPVKVKIARSVAATICEKAVAERQTRLYAYRHLQNLEAKAKRKTPSKELSDLSHQVMLDGVAAYYEQGWDVPAGSLRATAGKWRVSRGVELSDDAKEILAQLDRAEKREAQHRKEALEDAADMTDPVNARFAVQRRPAPKSTYRPQKVTVQQGQTDDGKRRARMTEDGR